MTIKKETLIQRLIKEPLFQFGIGGLIIFLLYAFFSPPQSETVVISKSMLEEMAIEKGEIIGRPLSRAEREELLKNYTEKEVLYREALKRGLDKNDSKLRFHLTEKIRFLLIDEPEDPSNDDLINYFNDNKDRFKTPPKISFKHVYYPSDSKTKVDLSILDKLKNGDDPESFGEKFWLGDDLKNYSQQELLVTFGKDFAVGIFENPANEWIGPVTSSRGDHFVFITNKSDEAVKNFDEVTNLVKEDYLSYNRRKSIEDKVAELKKDYNIRLANDGK